MEIQLEGILVPVELRDAEANRTFCTLYAPYEEITYGRNRTTAVVVCPRKLGQPLAAKRGYLAESLMIFIGPL